MKIYAEYVTSAALKAKHDLTGYECFDGWDETINVVPEQYNNPWDSFSNIDVALH